MAALARELARSAAAARRRWGNQFHVGEPSVAPLRGALAVWGLTVDDIAVASFHGTGTKLNDVNESHVTDQQLAHLGRTAGNPVLAVCQKHLTGHPKGAAAAWMLNGLLQVMQTGLVPGNRNADNVDAQLRRFQHIVYPNRAVQTAGVQAALLKSFGFGQAGGELLLVHPNRLLATLRRQQLEEYGARRAQREVRAYQYYQRVFAGQHTLVQVKTAPPYAPELEPVVYLNPTARAAYDERAGTWLFTSAAREPMPAPTPAPTPVPLGAAAAAGAAATTPSPQVGGAPGMLVDMDELALMPQVDSLVEAASLASMSATAEVARAATAELSGQVGAEFGPLSVRLRMAMHEQAEGLRGVADKGVGVDVEPVSTFADATPHFLARNFSAAEVEQCSAAARPESSFAGRWAAKEAVVKALSSTSPESAAMWAGAGAPLRDIEVLRSPSGVPVVTLRGHALRVAQLLGVRRVVVSISHTDEVAVAQAVAQ